ncbi:MAG: methyltransferase domain-containing protein [Lentisphaerae bacterium]|nr:methyltransferase domain-containing protein [Lentisphaerota bacterium]
MKAIYLPFEQEHWLGGAATFMQNLKGDLDRRNYPYLSAVQQAKVVFFPIAFPLPQLDIVKRQGGYIIQRLDGVCYPSKHGTAYADLNRESHTIYRDYADAVIFQSAYSQAQCFAMFGERDNNHIILNGVDTTSFYPSPASQAHSRQRVIKFITTGRFRNRDMLEPMIKALDALTEQFAFELTVIGPVVNPELESYLQRAYIRHIATLSLPDVAELLRQSDIFLYSHLNPPCPNSVIEAIACGLPVVGFDSGAMTELCFFATDLLAPVSDDVFQKYEDFDDRKLAEKITLAVEHYEHYREIALAHSSLYPFETCGRHYLEVFEAYLRKPRKLRPYATYLAQKGVRTMRRRAGTLKHRLLDRLGYSPEALFARTVSRMNAEQFAAALTTAIRHRTAALPPAKALKLLFDLDNRVYQLEGHAAIRYGDGLHTKHRHIKYHDFFVARIAPGSRVLDVGCGNGALAHDLALQVANVAVYAIDLAAQNIAVAQAHYAAENIRFVCGNALTDLPDQPIDVIVLSNVLEHLEQRVAFLQDLQRRYDPKQFLIRVPVFERDWRVPLKAELGVDYRLDPTHCIEYGQGEFEAEVAQAGLRIVHAQVNWGEIWAEVSRA